MMSKKGKPVTFRPSSADTRKWLERAQAAGFEMSEAVNACLDRVTDGMTEIEKVVRGLIERRTAELTELLPPKGAAKAGRPIEHGLYSKANGSDGKHPVKLTT